MEGKHVKDSCVTISYVMMPEDANPAGNVHGGIIMKHIDMTGGVAAMRHARCNVVTASIDSLIFHYPVFIGDLVTLRASLNLVARSSMEVGVRVETENLFTGEVRHTASAYLTFVALDRNGRPTPVPQLIPEIDDEKRRHRQAMERRAVRLAEKNKKAAEIKK
jgi:acyl-CoA hydrolase